MAEESHRTKVDSRKASRVGGREDHGSGTGDKGEGERNRGLFTPALMELAFCLQALSASGILLFYVHVADGCPVFPHEKHSPLATGLVPGVSGYGLDSCAALL